ncbi:MAG: ABC transporter permease [Lachnospiraceae bacterium]|jgi:ribose transport system permease protein|nr:ABC transporter permease [Lachnospiraceae bacterium]
MKLITLYKKYGVLFILLALVIFFSFAAPMFFSVTNLFNISKQVAIMAILSVGMTFVLLTGGIELSMGSVISLGVVLISKMVTEAGLPIAVSMLAAVVTATVLGFIDGLIIAKIKVPPLIITLGMQIFLYGFTYTICNGQPVYGIPVSLKWIGQTYVFGVIPVSAILMLIVILIGHFILTKTYLGRYFYAIGSNEETAKLSGINADKIRILAYTFCGCLVGIASIVMLGRIGSGQPSAGDGYEMDVLTGCVLGGVSLNGGKGNVAKAFAGILVIGVLSNGMALMGLDSFAQKMVKGVVLMLAVILDSLQFIEIRKKVKVVS